MRVPPGAKWNPTRLPYVVVEVPRRHPGRYLTRPAPTPPHAPLARSSALRLVALFEAAKGLVVLAAGTGLLLLIGRDVQAMAERFVAHLHLDPASRYPRIFINFTSRASPSGLRLLALGALVYAIVRLAEAVGLWHDKSWAEWLGVLTGAIYLPFELRAMIRHPGPEPLVALFINLIVLVVLAQRLQSRARAA